MRKQMIFDEFSRVLWQVFNKIYNRDMDSMLKKIKESDIEFTSRELQALEYLIRDLRTLKSQADQKERTNFFG